MKCQDCGKSDAEFNQKTVRHPCGPLCIKCANQRAWENGGVIMDTENLRISENGWAFWKGSAYEIWRLCEKHDSDRELIKKLVKGLGQIRNILGPNKVIQCKKGCDGCYEEMSESFEICKGLLRLAQERLAPSKEGK